VPLTLATVAVLRGFLATHPRRSEPRAPPFSRARSSRPSRRGDATPRATRVVPTADEALAALSLDDAADRLTLNWSTPLRHGSFYKAVYRLSVLRANRLTPLAVLPSDLRFHALRHTYTWLCVVGWVALVVPLLLLNMVFLLLNAPRMVATAWDSGARLVGVITTTSGLSVAAAVLQLVFLIIPVVGFGLTFLAAGSFLRRQSTRVRQRFDGQGGGHGVGRCRCRRRPCFRVVARPAGTPYRTGESGTVTQSVADLRYAGVGTPLLRSPAQAQQPLPPAGPNGSGVGLAGQPPAGVPAPATSAPPGSPAGATPTPAPTPGTAPPAAPGTAPPAAPGPNPASPSVPPRSGNSSSISPPPSSASSPSSASTPTSATTSAPVPSSGSASTSAPVATSVSPTMSPSARPPPPDDHYFRAARPTRTVHWRIRRPTGHTVVIRSTPSPLYEVVGEDVPRRAGGE